MKLVRRLLAGVFLLEQSPGFGQGEEVPIHFKLVLAAIVGDGNDVAYVVSAAAKEIGNQVNVNVVLHRWVLIYGRCRLRIAPAPGQDFISEEEYHVEVRFGGPGQSPVAERGMKIGGFYGGPGQSPTADLRVRSALLYATELPGHVALVYLDLDI